MPTPTATDPAAALRALRRRWRAAAAIVVLTIAAAVGVSRLGPTQYEATAQILLQQPEQVNAVLNPDAITQAANVQREINTNAKLITSVPVANAVRRRLGLSESAKELVARVSVSGEATSNLVEITVRDPGAERAAEIATSIALQYQAYRRRSAQDAIGSAIRSARARLRGMDPATRDSSEGRSFAARLHQLETGAAVATGGVQIVRRAAVPAAPVPRLGPLHAVVVLLLAGSLAGLAVAVLERVDRRLVDDDLIEDAFGLPIIARIPAPRAGAANDPERVDALDALAARLGALPGHGRGRVVMVAPAGPHPDCDVAIRLAEALSGVEPRVLLIDADLRHHPDRPSATGLAGGGLTAILCGESTTEEEIVLASYRQADDDPLPTRTWELIGAGAGTSRPAGLLGSRRMEGLMAGARARAGIVIVAGPPLTSSGEAMTLARHCDEILVVVQRRSATRQQARASRDLLGGTGTPAVGIALETGTGVSARGMLTRRPALDAARVPELGAGTLQDRDPSHSGGE